MLSRAVSVDYGVSYIFLSPSYELQFLRICFMVIKKCIVNIERNLLFCHISIHVCHRGMFYFEFFNYYFISSLIFDTGSIILKFGFILVLTTALS